MTARLMLAFGGGIGEAMIAFGVIIVTVLSIGAALSCGCEQVAGGRFVPLVIGLMMITNVLLAVVAIGRHDGALAMLVIGDVLALRYALTVRGRVLSARSKRLRLEPSRQANRHRSRRRPTQPPHLSTGEKNPSHGQS